MSQIKPMTIETVVTSTPETPAVAGHAATPSEPAVPSQPAVAGVPAHGATETTTTVVTEKPKAS